MVNERGVKDYFPRETGELVVLQPFDLTGTRTGSTCTVNVQGGGLYRPVRGDPSRNLQGPAPV